LQAQSWGSRRSYNWISNSYRRSTSRRSCCTSWRNRYWVISYVNWYSNAVLKKTGIVWYLFFFAVSLADTYARLSLVLLSRFSRVLERISRECRVKDQRKGLESDVAFRCYGEVKR
jgi:hypothetical protein